MTAKAVFRVLRTAGLWIYCTQFDRITISRLGIVGSFEFKCNRKSWNPSIPACMVKATVTVVDSPGLRTIEPMVGVGGQHPSFSSTNGSSTNRSVASPELWSSKVASTI